MEAPPKVFATNADYLMAGWRQVFILVWMNQTTVAGVATLKAQLDRFASTHPGGIGLLTVVEEHAPVPASDARAALAEFLHEAGSVIRYSGVVHEGSGFRAAAVRSVVTGLSLMARQPYPHKVFATVDEASRWLVPGLKEKVGFTGGPTDMIRAVEQLRQSNVARAAT